MGHVSYLITLISGKVVITVLNLVKIMQIVNYRSGIYFQGFLKFSSKLHYDD